MKRRTSKKRDQILETLQQSKGALSAAELHAKLPEIDLATIYRNLELFTTERVVRKLHLTEGEAHYEFQHHPHHHAICTDCEKVIHFTAPDEKIKQLLGLTDFQVDELELTVRGVCKHK